MVNIHTLKQTNKSVLQDAQPIQELSDEHIMIVLATWYSQMLDLDDQRLLGFYASCPRAPCYGLNHFTLLNLC